MRRRAAPRRADGDHVSLSRFVVAAVDKFVCLTSMIRASSSLRPPAFRRSPPGDRKEACL